MAKVKRYAGNRPDPLTSRHVVSFEEWELHELHTDQPRGNWVSFKLVARLPIPLKGNYSVSFGQSEQRFARSTDYKLFEQSHAALIPLLVSVITKYLAESPLPR